MVDAVRSRRTFSALSSSRHRGRSGPVWIVRSPAEADGTVQVAYAVNRAVGTAVVRNRIRRRLRAVFDDLEASGLLEPGAYLVGVRPEASTLDFAELHEHCRRALSRS